MSDFEGGFRCDLWGNGELIRWSNISIENKTSLDWGVFYCVEIYCTDK